MSDLYRSAEWAILIACCSPVRGNSPTPAIASALALGFDSKKLLLLAERHRVEGFLHAGLREAGFTLADRQWAELSRRAQLIRVKSTKYAMEEARLARLFGAAGIDALFVKGATTAMLAFGTVTVKSSRDVDMLVPINQRDASFELLTAAGYVLKIDGFSGDVRELHRYIAGNKDTVWFNETNGLCVELHTALTAIPGLIPKIGIESPRQLVLVPGGIEVPTLATTHLLTYLAVHGTIHGWQRLKWLVDASHVLARSGLDSRRFLDEATALGGGRAANVMLTLARRHLDDALTDPVKPGERTTRWLVKRSETILAHYDSTASSNAINGKLSDFISFAAIEVALAPGLLNKAREIWRSLGRPYHADHLRVPRWLLRPFMLFWLPGRVLTRYRRP